MIKNVDTQFKLVELTQIEEMLQSHQLLLQLYPKMSIEEYRSLLEETVPHNYKQVVVFDNDTMVGISGFWIATKIWCGKYLELDNVVVLDQYRSKGIGKLMTDYLYNKALENNCNMLGLDVYTDNFKGIKFYMNEGFVMRGFHMINVLKDYTK